MAIDDRPVVFQRFCFCGRGDCFDISQFEYRFVFHWMGSIHAGLKGFP
jgi:hypothetical protein